VEKHVFGDFVPENLRYLILGSFPVKQAVKTSSFYDEGYDFFYSIKRNQFWPILEKIYGRELKTKQAKQQLLSDLGIAMADIILKCERTRASNLDANLANFVYNTKGIKKILRGNQIEKVFFTSRFVEQKFRQVFKKIIENFPKIELITLPSPSPRYVLITKEQKIKEYQRLLPILN